MARKDIAKNRLKYVITPSVLSDVVGYGRDYDCPQDRPNSIRIFLTKTIGCSKTVDLKYHRLMLANHSLIGMYLHCSYNPDTETCVKVLKLLDKLFDSHHHDIVMIRRNGKLKLERKLIKLLKKLTPKEMDDMTKEALELLKPFMSENSYKCFLNKE